MRGNCLLSSRDAKCLNLLFYFSLLTSSQFFLFAILRALIADQIIPLRSWPRIQWDTYKRGEGKREREREKKNRERERFFPEEAIYGKIARRGVKNFERRATSGWVQQVIAGDASGSFHASSRTSSVRMTLPLLLCASRDARVLGFNIFQAVYFATISLKLDKDAWSLELWRWSYIKFVLYISNQRTKTGSISYWQEGYSDTNTIYRFCQCVIRLDGNIICQIKFRKIYQKLIHYLHIIYTHKFDVFYSVIKEKKYSNP